MIASAKLSYTVTLVVAVAKEEASSNTTFHDVETLLRERNTSIPFSWRPHNVVIKLVP
jgi:hypothetical protein